MTGALSMPKNLPNLSQTTGGQVSFISLPTPTITVNGFGVNNTEKPISISVPLVSDRAQLEGLGKSLGIDLEKSVGAFADIAGLKIEKTKMQANTEIKSNNVKIKSADDNLKEKLRPIAHEEIAVLDEKLASVASKAINYDSYYYDKNNNLLFIKKRGQSPIMNMTKPDHKFYDLYQMEARYVKGYRRSTSLFVDDKTGLIRYINIQDIDYKNNVSSAAIELNDTGNVVDFCTSGCILGH